MTLDRKPLDATAFGLMTVLCMLWGFQQVTIKVAAPDVSLVMQAGIRSIIATALLLVWARARGIPLFDRDGTLAAGLGAGVLFATEFVFIYAGLAYTAASRMIVFIYTTPCWTALMLPFFVPVERLSARQWVGVIAAFGGIVAAFAEGFTSAKGETFVGDLFGVIAAFLWASTIVLIRATRLARASATKTLFYQLAVSAAMLPVVSMLMGEPGIVRWTPLAICDPRLPGRDRRVRELPGVVLAADQVPGRAALGAELHDAALRRAVRRGSAGRADHAGIPRRRPARRRGHRARQPAGADAALAAVK